MTRMRVEPTFVIALGSNLGDREGTIRAAVAQIDAIPGVKVLRASGLVESAALTTHGVDEAQPAYLNAVISIRTAMDPERLLSELETIENANGRVRGERWGNRTLDIDIVAMGAFRRSSDRLTIPHPRAAQRAFVLAPWLEIEPDAAIPRLGRVDALLARTTDTVRPFDAEPLL